MKLIESFLVSLCYRIRYITICWCSKVPNFQISWKFWNPITTTYLHGMLWSNIFIKSHIYLFVSGGHCTYRQERKSRKQIGHGPSLIIEQSVNGWPMIIAWLHRIWIKLYLKSADVEKGCKKNCKCKKVEMIKCLPTCKCRKKCAKKVHILLLLLK